MVKGTVPFEIFEYRQNHQWDHIYINIFPNEEFLILG